MAVTKAHKIPQVMLFTDGACLGNPGPGGWAALLRFGKKEKLLVGKNPDTTNNQMEMKAVIEGLKALKKACEITVFTDSRYVMDGYNQWLPGWKAKNWRNSKKEPVKNKSLWQELDEQAARHKISWQWVKGHSGHPENERVDQAARDAAETLRSH
ncbi:ribonuclease HI [Marinicella sp. W31]|uniref:ribonuclease HI n=1 Tax=Marinicella sp. W31 TaxID=3023713 RepID=UPI0037569F69